MSDITTRLWERAEAAIEKGLRATSEPVPRHLAKLAAAALLRELSAEAAAAEDDDVEWPDSGDLAIIAADLEAKP
jgi:hypothetical protein